jgi:hypothetical protein
MELLSRAFITGADIKVVTGIPARFFPRMDGGLIFRSAV